MAAVSRTVVSERERGSDVEEEDVVPIERPRRRVPLLLGKGDPRKREARDDARARGQLSLGNVRRKRGGYPREREERRDAPARR